MLKWLVNVLFAVKVTSLILQGSNVYKFKEKCTQMLCSFGTGTILSFVREITQILKHY
jgi:hypothetical protein